MRWYFVYMLGPLEALLLNIPRANLAQVSADRIDEITRSMSSTEPQTSKIELPPLQSIVLQGCYIVIIMSKKMKCLRLVRLICSFIREKSPSWSGATAAAKQP
jgi:hypothetical protein